MVDQPDPIGEPRGSLPANEQPPAPSGIEEAVRSAEAAEEAARDILQQVERVIREEKWAAAQEVNKRFADELDAARRAVYKACRATTAARDLTPEHPWTGKRVFRLKPQGPSWYRQPPKRIEGVVETMRSTTVLPGNTAGYSRPMLGAGFVRLLKADGSLGLQFTRLHPNDGWALVEDPAPETPPSASAEGPRHPRPLGNSGITK
jgi:hypothetical protein